MSLLAAIRPAFASAEPVTNETCMGCHGQTDLSRERGGSVHVDLARLQASPHGRLACVACHSGVTEVPHSPRLPSVACGSCHRDAAAAISGSAHRAAGGAGGGCMGCHGTGHTVRRAARTGVDACAGCHARETTQYRGSVHGVALAAGDPEASTCRDCHGPFHSIRRRDDPLSPVNRANLPQTCARCHANRALTTRRRITIPEAYALYEKSVHGRSKDPRAATCSDCHGSHDLRRATDSSSSIFHTNVPRTCGRCHARQFEAYETGIHGQALRRGVTAAPACTDCHGEHLIRGPRDPDSPVTGAAVTTTCSRCHEAQGLRETFGLPAGRLTTYRDSYHGLAARGGATAVANCASCHGYHDILPSSDPRSAVNPRRLGETCGKCHPGAGTRFAMGPVHVAVTARDVPILYYVRLGYLWLIGLTIGGMALHQGLDFLRKLQRHWRRHRGPAELRHGPVRWHLRMTRIERAQHALLLVSFFTLVGTGFALKFPESWLFSWLTRLEGGFALRSFLHRAAAVVLIGTSLAHVGYLFTRRGRGVFAALVPTLRDVREAATNLLYLAGLRRTAPTFDRFSYIEKAEYWALVWGTVVMSLTGLLLWFENQSLRWLPKWTIDLATMVHYYEAWLAFLAILVWHIYQNVLNPDVYPMSWTWVTGLMSDEQLQHEHGAEWLRLDAEERARAAEAQARADGLLGPEADRGA
ncbi:MAG TPA: cytochrome b/b6 domain-containing protein [Terriglobales bacterium]|nr:cytochrome b/b6 domain-containing protein [Terriglobales bacterium]